MNAKDTLELFIPKIEERLEKYWNKELSLHFGFNERERRLVAKMLTHSKEHNLRTAKRIRGAFVYYGYLLGNTTIDERIWEPAMSVELVQTALLMHDDVMDQDVVRRGKPTTHKFFEDGNPHYGESMAYVTGDVVLSLGYELLCNARFDKDIVNKATSRLLRGIINTGYGQAYDVTLANDNNAWTEDDVLSLHKAKTAIYTYENPLCIGAILANLDEKVLDVLSQYSMDGGVCFQLQDDILGVFGNPEKTGKSADSDLLQGKNTLLVQKAFELGTDEQKHILTKVWGKRTADQKDIERAKQTIIKTGSLEYSKELSRKLAKNAVDTAQKLHEFKLNPDAISFIQGIAEYMVTREL